MTDILKSVRRIVVKVGSSILVENEEIASHRVTELCKFLADLRTRYEVILVTSGAVACGHTTKVMDKSSPANKQALAAVGQPMLMHMYSTEFQKHNILCAEMMLSSYDLDSGKRTDSARRAIDALLKHSVLPIINENAATAVPEFDFGDNDRLSAAVAHNFNAGLLVILSDIDGYYTAHPHICKDAKVRRVVHKIDPADLVAEATPNNRFATGGIVTKLQAAQYLLEMGEKMYLSSGFQLEKIRPFLLGGRHEIGTLFLPSGMNYP
ncbi:hypothetical protein JKF63_04329 [Porcisia hertigi]|uniref:Aspartate/glutamate/uridylate kinase domain-containing protein n=1 Tax=Porcisia hertigi TaxID=2761500 RepID=A0A836IBG8_9TRYP|nr:hypothetical protein JKF63_04329 [Porcisia hertigi]